MKKNYFKRGRRKEERLFGRKKRKKGRENEKLFSDVFSVVRSIDAGPYS